MNRRPSHQGNYTNSLPPADASFLQDALQKDPFACRSADRMTPQLVVNRLGRRITKPGWHGIDHVEAGRASVDHCLLHIGKLVLKQQPHAWHEVVRLPELGNALAIPSVPAIIDRARNNVIVLLKHGYVVTIPRKKKCGTKSADATTNNDDFAHERTLLSVARSVQIDKKAASQWQLSTQSGHYELGGLRLWLPRAGASKAHRAAAVTIP